MNRPAAEALAGHFSRLAYDEVPSGVTAKMKTLLLDFLGVAIAGSQKPSGEIAGRFALECAGQPVATLIGGGGKVAPPDAAFANAISSHSVELDDVDALALFHYSPAVFPAGLAAAERCGADGRALLLALVSGCDLMARVSNATNYALRNRGFHTTPACGVFGAALAAGLLARLSPEQLTSALGLSGAQASGLMEMYGPSMQKRFNPGPAARGGMTAAMMAEFGFSGASTIFDGKYGFCTAYSDDADPVRLTEDLGTAYHLDIEYKPYSCARPIHNAIDCAINIHNRLGGATGAIAKLTMERHPLWAGYHLNRQPANFHEAQVSLPFSVAVALIEGKALPAQYSADRLGDPEIARLSQMLEVRPAADLPRGVSCRLEVDTDDGRTMAVQVDHPLGSLGNPMTPDAMQGKFHMLADPVVGPERAARIVDMVARMEDHPVSELMALTARAADARPLS